MNWWQWVLVGVAIWAVAVLPLSVVMGAFLGMTSRRLYPDPWDVDGPAYAEDLPDNVVRLDGRR